MILFDRLSLVGANQDCKKNIEEQRNSTLALSTLRAKAMFCSALGAECRGYHTHDCAAGIGRYVIYRRRPQVNRTSLRRASCRVEVVVKGFAVVRAAAA